MDNNIMRIVGVRNQMSLVSMVKKIMALVFLGYSHYNLSDSIGIPVLAGTG